MEGYETRLKIPIAGSAVELCCVKGEVLCRGYTRVVIGARGPYVEMNEEQIEKDSFYEVHALHRYFVELRSDRSEVMCYYQLERVDYADYRPGMFYISPFDLYLGEKRCIDPCR